MAVELSALLSDELPEEPHPGNASKAASETAETRARHVGEVRKAMVLSQAAPVPSSRHTPPDGRDAGFRLRLYKRWRSREGESMDHRLTR